MYLIVESLNDSVESPGLLQRLSILKGDYPPEQGPDQG